MHSNFLFKFIKLLPLINANGTGPSSGSNGGFSLAGGLANVLTDIAEFLVGIATTIYGWLMTLAYKVIKLVLNIMDVLQFFVNKLVGIDIYGNPDWGNIVTLQESDLIIKLITTPTVLKLFRAVLILSAVLLVIFCIISIVKSNFDVAMGSDEGKEPASNKVMKKAAKSIFMCFLVPILLIVGILGSNVILASICNAIKGDNDLTIGGIIFTTSSYDANKYRTYAKNGLRVPMYNGLATQVINQGNFQTADDMRALFYHTAKGDVYIEGITEPTIEKRDAGDFDEWYDKITEMDTNDYTESINATMSTENIKHILEGLFNEEVDEGAGAVATEFEKDFREWYEEYFDSTPLDDFGASSKITKKIKKSNWPRNKKLEDVYADWSSTYYISADNLYFNSTGSYVNIFDNTLEYSSFESFATLEYEYYVMADFMDYAIEHNKQFYYVNADNSYIRWSDISISEDPDEELINIDCYSNQYAVFKYFESGEPKYFTYYGDLSAIEASGVVAVSTGVDGEAIYTHIPTGNELELLSTNAFYVSYFDGTNRLYWSADNKTREQDGATYIICTMDEMGYYIPVTDETTDFHTDFFAEDYHGPIVARGIFETTSILPQKSPNPTAIREQYVDESGNEIIVNSTIGGTSLKVVNYTKGNPVSNTSLSKYIGYTIGGDGLSSTMIVDGGSGDEFIRGTIQHMSASIDDGSGANYINVGSSNCYINRNIKNYKFGYDADGNVTNVTFYDSNGLPMSWGGGSVSGGEVIDEDDTTLLPVSALKKVYLYYMHDADGRYYPVVSYSRMNDFDDLWKLYQSNLGSITHLNEIGKVIVIQYDAYEIAVSGSSGSAVKMYIGAEASGIYQKGYNDNKFVKRGIFAVPSVYSSLDVEAGEDSYNLYGGVVPQYLIDANRYKKEDIIDLYTTELKTLHIKNGEVYFADGQAFMTRQNASALFDNYCKDFSLDRVTIEDTANVLSELLNGRIGGELQPYFNSYMTKIEEALGSGEMYGLIKEGSTYKVYVEKFDEDDVAYYEAVPTTPENLFIYLTSGIVSLSIDDIKEIVYSMIYGQEFLIGMASGVQPLTVSYFAYNQEGENVKVSLLTTDQTLAKSGVQLDAQETLVTEAVNADKNYGMATSNIEITLSVVMKTGAADETKVSAVVVGDNVGSYQSSGNKVYKYKLTYDLKYTTCAGFAFGGTISNLALTPVNPELVGAKQFITLKNGAVYCPSMKDYVLSIDSMKEIALLQLSEVAVADGGLEGIDTVALFGAKAIANYNNLYIYFEKGEFDYDFIFDVAFHSKGETILDGMCFRLNVGFVTDYFVDVKYRLEGGGFLLNYNFNKNTGIAIGNLFDMRYINPLVLLLATAIVFGMLWNMVWNLITRIYEIAIRFIVLPAVLATDVLSDGKFKEWKEAVVGKVMSAYAVLIMLNLYFALIPSINEMTTGLVSWDELPSTFTGMFANIGVGGGTGLLANIGNFGNGLIANIVSLVAGIKESTIISVSGWLNKIIFMMFLLVLTTLVKQGPTILGKFTGGDGDIAGDDTWKSVKGLKKDYDESFVGKNLNRLGSLAGNLALKGIKAPFKGIASLLGSGGRGGGRGRRRFSTRALTGDDVRGSDIGSLSKDSEVSGSRVGSLTADTDIKGSSVGALVGNTHITGSPITVKTSSESRYGAGGRVIVPDTGVEGHEEESRKDEEKTKPRVAGAMDMAHSDGGYEESTPSHSHNVTYSFGGGATGGSGAKFDEVYEPVKIDEGLNSEELYNKSQQLMDDAMTKRGEASIGRELAESAYTSEDEMALQRLEADVEELKVRLTDAQTRRGEAYEWKMGARRDGGRVDAVEVDGKIVNAQQLWEDASREVKALEAELDDKQEAIKQNIEQKQLQSEMLAEAERLEREADEDDRLSAEYFEAAQDKEMEESLVKNPAFKKLKEEVDTLTDLTTDLEGRLDDKVETLTDLTTDLEGRLDEKVEALTDLTTELEGKLVDRVDGLEGKVDANKQDVEALTDLTTEMESNVFDTLATKADASLTDQAINSKADAELTKQAIDSKADIELTQTAIDTKADAELTQQAIDTKADSALTKQAVDSKADAELTKQAIDTKADIGIVANIANVTGAGVKKKGKHAGEIVGNRHKKGKGQDISDDDDDDFEESKKTKRKKKKSKGDEQSETNNSKGKKTKGKKKGKVKAEAVEYNFYLTEDDNSATEVQVESDDDVTSRIGVEAPELKRDLPPMEGIQTTEVNDDVTSRIGVEAPELKRDLPPMEGIQTTEDNDDVTSRIGVEAPNVEKKVNPTDGVTESKADQVSAKLDELFAEIETEKTETKKTPAEGTAEKTADQERAEIDEVFAELDEYLAKRETEKTDTKKAPAEGKAEKKADQVSAKLDELFAEIETEKTNTKKAPAEGKAEKKPKDDKPKK